MQGSTNLLNLPKLDPTNDQVATGATADQTGGLSMASVVSVSTGFDAQVIKASAGRVYAWTAFNFDGTKLAFIKLYDKATTPDPSADAALLKWQIYVPPSATTADQDQVSLSLAHGLAFADGIALVITQDANAGETAVDAADVFLQMAYK